MDQLDAHQTPPAAPRRLGAPVQLGVALLVVVGALGVVALGPTEPPDLVRGGGPFTDELDLDGPLSPWWSLPAGDLVVRDGAASVTEAGEDGTVLAVRYHGLRQRTTSITVAAAAEGAGMLLGYRSPDDYWAVVASPSTGTWLIVHVLEGTVRDRYTTGPARAEAGTVVTAAVNDDALTVRIGEGAPVSVPLEQRLATTDGLVVLPGGSPAAAWDRFEVRA